MKATQKKMVRNKLNSLGFVTRNEALRSRITRLSAIIFKLKQEGMNIEGEYYTYPNGNQDYIYRLKDEE